MMKRVMLACAALALAGCDTIVEVVPETLTVDFTATKAPYQANPPVNVGGEAGQIRVNGGLFTPCSGYQLSARAQGELAGDPIVVRVIAEPPGGGACLTVVEGFSYQAVVKDVAPGSHRVRVLHEIKPNAPVEVASVTVQVQ